MIIRFGSVSLILIPFNNLVRVKDNGTQFNIQTNLKEFVNLIQNLTRTSKSIQNIILIQLYFRFQEQEFDIYTYFLVLGLLASLFLSVDIRFITFWWYLHSAMAKRAQTLVVLAVNKVILKELCQNRPNCILMLLGM